LKVIDPQTRTKVWSSFNVFDRRNGEWKCVAAFLP